MRRFRYLAPAQAELRDAYRYYRERSPRVASAFRAEIEAVIELLLAFPQSAPPIHGDIRGKSLERFPYKLIYRLDDDGVVIVAVAHHRQRPNYWMER